MPPRSRTGERWCRPPVPWRGVATDADFAVSAGGHQTTMPVRITFVLEQRDGEWRIAHAHYSLAPAPAG